MRSNGKSRSTLCRFLTDMRWEYGLQKMRRSRRCQSLGRRLRKEMVSRNCVCWVFLAHAMALVAGCQSAPPQVNDPQLSQRRPQASEPNAVAAEPAQETAVANANEPLPEPSRPTYNLMHFLLNSNFQQVVPQKIYRSGQPTPKKLRQWIHEYGIHTVVNLRGQYPEIMDEERLISKERGVKLITFEISANSVPSRTVLAEIIGALKHAQLPVLIHCRDGIDRTGTISAMAVMVLAEASYDQAKHQAYIPPKTLRKGSEHISDIFVLYEGYCQSKHLNTNDWQTFEHWAIDTYEPPH